MPLYDYACERCGRFSASRPLREYDRPAPCPACGQDAPRAIGVPALLKRGSAGGAGGAGHDGHDGYRRLRHAGGCGCCPA